MGKSSEWEWEGEDGQQIRERPTPRTACSQEELSARSPAGGPGFRDLRKERCLTRVLLTGVRSGRLVGRAIQQIIYEAEDGNLWGEGLSLALCLANKAAASLSLIQVILGEGVSFQ